MMYWITGAVFVWAFSMSVWWLGKVRREEEQRRAMRRWVREDRRR